MRIQNREKRLEITKDNYEEMFDAEYDYYTKNNQYPVVLYGQRIINIYKNINIQVLVTRECTKRCWFCCEAGDDTDIVMSDNIYGSLIYLLEKYTEIGITSNVSITGGEPTLYPGKVNKLIEICDRYKVKAVVNTNGYNIKPIHKCLMNVSVQGIHDLETHDRESLCLQKMIVESDVKSVVMFMNYYYYFNCIKLFSFRGMYDRPGDYFELVSNVSNDNRFEFIQQKIGDYYHFEMYKYLKHNCFLRFTFADMSFLREKEVKEKVRYSRANIIQPNGDTYTGWNYDLNLLGTTRR